MIWNDDGEGKEKVRSSSGAKIKTHKKLIPFCPYHFVYTILPMPVVRTILFTTILSGHRLKFLPLPYMAYDSRALLLAYTGAGKSIALDCTPAYDNGTNLP